MENNTFLTDDKGKKSHARLMAHAAFIQGSIIANIGFVVIVVVVVKAVFFSMPVEPVAIITGFGMSTAGTVGAFFGFASITKTAGKFGENFNYKGGNQDGRYNGNGSFETQD